MSFLYTVGFPIFISGVDYILNLTHLHKVYARFDLNGIT
nr:MAG TPA: hypothetical protein [Caudoviricetes sp.]